LANNFSDAILRSHPGNSIEGLKSLIRWILDICPERDGIFHGSYEIVNRWINMSDDGRRFNLEKLGLIFTEEEEIIMTLRGDKISPQYEKWAESLA
jgi:hypothetical protein